jgi:hypothetical protein
VSYSEVLREEVTWRLLSDARPSFRRGTYAVLTAMCMRVPSFVRQTGQVGGETPTPTPIIHHF